MKIIPIATNSYNVRFNGSKEKKMKDAVAISAFEQTKDTELSKEDLLLLGDVVFRLRKKYPQMKNFTATLNKSVSALSDTLDEYKGISEGKFSHVIKFYKNLHEYAQDGRKDAQIIAQSYSVEKLKQQNPKTDSNGNNYVDMEFLDRKIKLTYNDDNEPLSVKIEESYNQTDMIEAIYLFENGKVTGASIKTKDKEFAEIF